jgi:hypothetical protein
MLSWDMWRLWEDFTLITIGFAVSRSENLTGRRMRVTQPFDASTLLSIDPERCRRVDFAQDRELVEWQMGVFRQAQ